MELYPCDKKWPLGDRVGYQIKCKIQKMKPNKVWVVWSRDEYENNPEFKGLFYSEWNAHIEKEKLGGSRRGLEIEEIEIK